MKFSIKDFFSKSDHIRSFLWKLLTENFILVLWFVNKLKNVFYNPVTTPILHLKNFNCQEQEISLMNAYWFVLY